MKKPLIVANLKLNGNKKFIKSYLKKLCYKLKNNNLCNVVVSPPLVYLQKSVEITKESNIKICSQNVDINLFGAFTGETSIIMLNDIGVKYIIVGHSERRIYHKEDNEIILKKFNIIKKNNLIPILCIGETLEEKNNGKTEEICLKQIDLILTKIGIKAFKNCVIAYEPIWAIGKKISATPLEVQKINKLIRLKINSYDKKISKNLILQYGGSVNEKNIKNFLIEPDIDGVLIGGASLNFEKFIKIIKNSRNIKN